MASIGNILLRPQTLARLTSDTETHALDLLAGLLTRLVEDFATGGGASKKIVAAIQSEMNGFIGELQPRMDAANDKVKALLAPYLSGIEAFKDFNFDDPSLYVPLLDKIIALIEKLLDELHSDKLIAKINELADILEKDLGFSYHSFEQLFRSFFDAVVEALAKDFLSGVQTEEAVNQFALSRQMLKTEQYVSKMIGQAPIPSFSRQALISEIQNQLVINDWDKKLDDIHGQMDQIKAKLLTLLPLITDMLKPSAAPAMARHAGTDSADAPAVAENQFSLHDSAPSMADSAGTDGVDAPAVADGVDAPAVAEDQFTWYGSWFAGEPTAVADRFDLKNSPVGVDMGLDSGETAVPSKFLEHWAHWTYAAAEIAKAVIYGFAVKDGRFKENPDYLQTSLYNREVLDPVSPGLNMGFSGTTGIVSLFSTLMDGKDWTAFYKVFNKSFLQKGTPEVLTAIGSFCNTYIPNRKDVQMEFGEWFWVFYLDKARGKISDGKEWPDLIYDLCLSFFTLVNSKNKNKEKIKGFTAMGRYGGVRLACLILGRKDRYEEFNFRKGNVGNMMLNLLMGGVMTFSGEVISWCIAAIFSRGFSERYWKFEKEGGEGFMEFIGEDNAYGGILLWSFLEFFFNYGGFWEGNNDNGHLGVRILPQYSGDPVRQQIEFSGYPEKSGSPYLLPFVKGIPVLCVQSNMGFSSNNYRNGMIYAVDFALRKDQPVLAMRDGIVEEFTDDLENSKADELNYIVIRHDPANADHDKGEGGNVVTTYAVYENPKKDSVKSAFLARGIPKGSIVGSKVKQGDILMLLGNRPGFITDKNFCLRVRISAEKDRNLGIGSIPFVFKNLPGNGVPQKGTYYESTNESK